MAPFGDNEYNRLDFTAIRDNGGILLYHKVAVLEEDIAWFRGAAYRVIDLDFVRCASFAEFHRMVGAGFEFPDWYGKHGGHPDGFHDMVTEIEVPSVGGTAVVFRRFDKLHALDSQQAKFTLDSLSWASHFFLMFGKRLVVLAQSDDPHLGIDRLRVHSPGRSPRER